MWLQDFHPNLSTEKTAARLSDPSESRQTISLRPHKLLPPRSFHGQSPFGPNVGCGNTDNQGLRSSDKCLNGNFGENPENAWGFGLLLDYSIRGLILRQPRRRIEGLGELRSANSFSLSDVAPLAFSPGYCDVRSSKYLRLA